MSLVQVHEPAALELLKQKIGGFIPAGTTNLPFRVPTPDSRLTMSLSLLFTQPNNTTGNTAMPFDVTFGATFAWNLWLAARDRDLATGIMVPTVSLVGTRTVPMVIPTDVNICGYADDFDGGQDEIYGEFSFTLGAPSGAPGGLRVSVQARYEPTSVEICDEEWRQIVSLCTPQLLGPQVVV